jgi:tetratricopeptide (TPR) repeat protein
LNERECFRYIGCFGSGSVINRLVNLGAKEPSRLSAWVDPQINTVDPRHQNGGKHFVCGWNRNRGVRLPAGRNKGFGKMTIPLVFILLIFVPPTFKAGEDLRQAIYLYQRGEFKRAVNLLEELKNASSDHAEIRFWLAKSYVKIRKWDDAVREMEKAVALQPSNADYHLWLGRFCGFQAEHSSFIKAPFRARRVLKEFEAAQALAPDDLDVRFDLLEYYLEAPGFLGGGKDKAEIEAKVIAKLNPMKGYIARATIYRKSKDWNLAQKELTQATIEYPNNADVWKDLADFLLDRQDFQGAFNCAKRALSLESDSKQAKLILAASEIRLGKDLDQAAETLKALASGTLSEEEPDFETVYYWLGECYLAKGNKVEARKAFESALSYNPDFSKAKDSLSQMK